MPVSLGIETSVTTRSGASLSTHSTSAAPSQHLATTAKSGGSRLATASIISGKSSARTTRICLPELCTGYAGRSGKQKTRLKVLKRDDHHRHLMDDAHARALTAFPSPATPALVTNGTLA